MKNFPSNLTTSVLILTEGKRFRPGGLSFFLAIACMFFFGATDTFRSEEIGPFLHIAGALFFAGIGIYCFFEKDEDKIYVAGGHNHLDLDAAKPDQQTVESFISELHCAMRTYFKEKYGEVSPILEKNHQYHNFQMAIGDKSHR